MRNDVKALPDSEIVRKMQNARQRNSATAWRDLAKHLVKLGYREDSELIQQINKNAELLEGEK